MHKPVVRTVRFTAANIDAEVTRLGLDSQGASLTLYTSGELIYHVRQWDADFLWLLEQTRRLWFGDARRIQHA